jgi:hypothetical protein
VSLRCLVPVTVILAACGDPGSSCEQLNKYAPKGVYLATNEQECARILEFSRIVPASYKMSFTDWLSNVLPQRVLFATDAVDAVSEQSTWVPTTFGPEPAIVPCGPGLPVTDAFWQASTLQYVLRERPTTLYVSLAVKIDNNVATIDTFQDFNCDHKLGVNELVGAFKKGLPAPAGGWTLMNSVSAPIDQ